MSIQVLRVGSDTAFWVTTVVWLVSSAAILHPRVEGLLAWKAYRLRPPNELEASRLGPAWFGACAAAGVDPNRYRVWVHEGPEATAPVTAGAPVAVTTWSIHTLPPRHLEAILAHELAHRLALPAKLTLWLYWLSLPARLMGKAIMAGLRHPVLAIAVKVVLVGEAAPPRPESVSAARFGSSADPGAPAPVGPGERPPAPLNRWRGRAAAMNRSLHRAHEM